MLQRSSTAVAPRARVARPAPTATRRPAATCARRNANRPPRRDLLDADHAPNCEEAPGARPAWRRPGAETRRGPPGRALLDADHAPNASRPTPRATRSSAPAPKRSRPRDGERFDADHAPPKRKTGRPGGDLSCCTPRPERSGQAGYLALSGES